MISGNTHHPHDCPYCWRVLYSRGALTKHVNEEHWKELAADIAEEDEETVDVVS